MDIEIRKLTPDLLEDYLRFFDNVAFSDHAEWSGCYCVEPHVCELIQEELPKGAKSIGRNWAIDFIKGGKLQGYLAYSNGEVVGWCNANDKQNYEKLVAWKEVAVWKEVWTTGDEQKKIKSIMCFVISPNMRGKGIATALLEHICADALIEGYDMVEAYPYKGDPNAYDCYAGPVTMYEKQGFVSLRELEYILVMRKYLKP